MVSVHNPIVDERTSIKGIHPACNKTCLINTVNNIIQHIKSKIHETTEPIPKRLTNP